MISGRDSILKAKIDDIALNFAADCSRSNEADAAEPRRWTNNHISIIMTREKTERNPHSPIFVRAIDARG